MHLPLSRDNYKMEFNTIKQIAINNNFRLHLINSLHNKQIEIL